MMKDIAYRVATANEYERIEAAYAAWGYRGGVLPNDVVYVADAGGKLVGVVRRTCEEGVIMLLGMYVAPHTAATRHWESIAQRVR